MSKSTLKKRKFYWDADVFLSAINANQDRLPVIEAILDDCEQDNAEVYTSMLSIVEVAFAETEKQSRLLDDKTEEKINKLWLPPSPVKLIEINEFVLWDAKALMRNSIKQGWSLKPNDAIHLATAKRLQPLEIHVYDKGWCKYSQEIGCTICAPKIDRLPFPVNNETDD